MFTPERFLTPFLQNHPRGGTVARMVACAFQSVHAGEALRKFLRTNPLPAAKRTFALGLGKAACAMTSALADTITLTEALIITKHAARLDFGPVTVIEGDHPIPGEASLAAGCAAREFVARLSPRDLLICLVSGGGSALMTAPVIPLPDLQALTSALLASGARIDEINTVRRHLDFLKGGGLAQAANGAQIVSLILSDVVGDAIEAIACGPTAPDPSTRQDALKIVGQIDNFSKSQIVSVIARRVIFPTKQSPIRRGDCFAKNARNDGLLEMSESNRDLLNLTYPFRETLKPGAPLFRNVRNHIIASNEIALRAAKKQAEAGGFFAEIIEAGMQGEAREVGRRLAERLKETVRIRPRPFCLLAGGETTVTLRGDGQGGRNQELVLGAVEALRGMQDILLLSIATDGEDGPTDAAGALATGESAQRAESLGMAAADYLSRNDAYSFFAKLDDLIKPGPSGTNVNDLVFLFAF